VDWQSETLLVRALNHARGVSLPAYVGLRFLCENASRINRSSWVEEFCRRRLDTVRKWRFSRFNVLKTATRDSYDYRQTVIGSPVTLVTEALILRSLSVSSRFQRRPNVYSYLWPRSRRAGGNFELFYRSYVTRNQAITNELESDKDNVSVVTDIRSFYPSAKADVVLDRFVQAVRSADDIQPKEGIIKFAIDLMEASPSGIPIGPNLSHVFGNLALESVDIELAKRFGRRYLRYVDDIVVVCKSHEAASTLDYVGGLLERENLSLNESKTETASREAWRYAASGASPRDGVLRFEDLALAIELYLSRNPNDLPEVRDKFLSAGFNLPLVRWKAAAVHHRVRVFLSKQLWRRPFADIYAILSSQPNDLVSMAERLRPVIDAELDHLLADIPQSGLGRRIALQRLRYLVNRVIYLNDINEYGRLVKKLARVPEFYETEVLLRCLISSDATAMLLMPGRTVAAFTELWRESRKDKPKIDWNKFRNKVSVDPAATLLLGGLAEVPEGIRRKLNAHQQELLAFCVGNRDTPSELIRGSFVEEIRALQNRRTSPEIVAFLESRFSDAEETGLQLFRLDSDYSYY
jgi:hypothetical protein